MVRWTTVSLPTPLAKAIKDFTEEIGYWNSVSSFVRAACVEKLNRERARQRTIKEEDEG